jgi:hypothetical protein
MSSRRNATQTPAEGEDPAQARLNGMPRRHTSSVLDDTDRDLKTALSSACFGLCLFFVTKMCVGICTPDYAAQVRSGELQDQSLDSTLTASWELEIWQQCLLAYAHIVVCTSISLFVLPSLASVKGSESL